MEAEERRVCTSATCERVPPVYPYVMAQCREREGWVGAYASGLHRATPPLCIMWRARRQQRRGRRRE